MGIGWDYWLLSSALWASSFGEADLMHHDIPHLPSSLWAFKGV